MLEYSHYKNSENFQAQRSNIKVIVNLIAFNLSSSEFGNTPLKTGLKFRFANVTVKKEQTHQNLEVMQAMHVLC